MSGLRAQMDRKRMLEYTEATSSRKLPDPASQGRAVHWTQGLKM